MKAVDEFINDYKHILTYFKQFSLCFIKTALKKTDKSHNTSFTYIIMTSQSVYWFIVSEKQFLLKNI